MTFSTPVSNAIPIWVTVRDSSGALAGPIPDLALSVGAGSPQPVSWDGGMGLCTYPLDTIACPRPSSLSVTTNIASLSPTSTNPTSMIGLLPAGLTVLSNVVCSHTCLHFIAVNPATGILSLASFRPSDDPSTDNQAIVWSGIPSVGYTPSSYRIGYNQTTIMVSLASTTDIQSFTGPTPEVINGTLAPTSLSALTQTPGFTGTILYSMLFDNRPLLIVNVGLTTNIWLPSVSNKTGISYTVTDPGVSLILTAAVVTPATASQPPTAWLVGKAAGAAMLVQIPLTTMTPLFIPNMAAPDIQWMGISANPTGIFVCGETSGVWCWANNAWKAYGGSGAIDILSTIWCVNDPWNPLPGDAAPVTLGVHTLVPRILNLTGTTDPYTLNQTIMTTEHLSLASLDETPLWLATGQSIQPVPLATPIWDDRTVYEAPEHPGVGVVPYFQHLVPAPALETLQNPPKILNPLDPTGTFLINLNPIPSPTWMPSGVTLYTDTQIFTYPYPDTKMNYPALSVSMPVPSVATVPVAMFPPADTQANVTGLGSGTTQAVKAVISGSNILISLIALNTTNVYLDSSLNPLPPVLIDYAIGLRTGQTSLMLTLTNLDHSVTVQVPIS